MKLVRCFFLIFWSLALNAQTFDDVSYSVNPDPVPNPERGFYHQVENFDLDMLQNFSDDGVRLILKNYSLEGFNNKPLSSNFINGLKSDFDMVRAGGFKIIVRFAYTFNLTTPYGDAPLDIVLQHIEQLKYVLKDNSDIILTFQAGFIGTWGEWYYTDYFSQSPGVITEQNWTDRRTVVNALLDVMPTDRMIQLRTPTFKKKMAELTDWDPISLAEAYNGSTKSRLAFHNDCFVASNTDYGTYNDIAVEKAYLEEDTKYMIVGGETCNPSAQSNCVNSVEELERFHWTFLNLDYHQGVLNQWKSEGCWGDVETKLGFRYELIDAHLQKEAKPNGAVSFQVKLINKGWANPTNAYTIQLNLRNTASQEVYVYTIDDDIRKWPLGVAHTIDVAAGLPGDIPFGNYALSLVLKDSRQTLAFSPNYRIQTANQGTWNDALGENELNHLLTVSSQSSLPTYAGSNYFVKEGTTTAGFAGPEQMKISPFNENAVIYWSREKQSNNQVVRLQRSTDNVNFETIAINTIDNIAFTDKNLDPNTTYFYRTQYILNNQYSQATMAQFTTLGTFDKEFVNISIDNDVQDWNAVEPVATGSKNGMVALRFMNTSNYLYFMMEAAALSTYEIVMETGNNKIFKISDGKLYESIGGTWSFKNNIDVQLSTNSLEGRVELQEIEFVEPTSMVGQFLVNNMDVWGGDYVFQKYPSLNPPDNFMVKPSTVTPLSKVKLSWTYNPDADGYVIERSIGDDQHFEFLKELGKLNSYYLDGGLDSELTYYYRMFAFKDIIGSEYTETLDIKLGPTATTNIESPFEYVTISPNPMMDFGKIDLFAAEAIDCTITLFDAHSKSVKQLYDGKILGKMTIPLSTKNLKSGLYFVKIQTPNSCAVQKIMHF